MTKLTLIILLALPGAALAQAPSADDLARRAIDAVGGPAWEKVRYIAFTFKVENAGKGTSAFPQKWDRFTGEYRVSGKDPQGNDFEIVMNVNARKGRATLNGTPVTDIRKHIEMMNLGVRRFVNDTFWLLMPLKMLEPVAHRTSEGQRNDSCGRVWDVLKLTFDEGSLMPGDVYWAWINHDTGIVEEWDIRLATKPDKAPTEVILRDFRRISGVLISTRREIRGENQNVRLEDLQILQEVPKGAFR